MGASAKCPHGMCPQMLTDTKVRKAKSTEKTYRLYDRDGLYLEVTAAGGKYWRLKYRLAGKEKRAALGVYPAVTLAAAREATLIARQHVATGADPIAARNADKQAATALDPFEAIAREWHAKFSPGWSETHGRKLLRRLELHVFPVIGTKPIAQLASADVLALIRVPEERGDMEIAHGIRIVVGQVCRYAVATARAGNDPTPALRGAIKPMTVKHAATRTDPRDVGALIRAIRDYNGGPVVRTALVLSALTFQRPGNVRMMEWTELDLDAGMWAIPSAKMKRKKEDKERGVPHLVPLCSQAVDALRKIQPVTGHGRYVFPGERTHDRPMSENTVTAALRSLGYSNEQMTAHGFRAMARTLLDEILEEPIHVIEAQLAHKVRDALGNAYNRTSHIEQRRKMMQRWADYLDTLEAGANVILFTSKAA